MGRIGALGCMLAVALLFGGCASGDPRLQGTWQSNKVAMPTEMVKVTKMETVKVRKGSKKTKKVPKTVMVAKTKSAPPYIDLMLKYEGSTFTMVLPSQNGDKPLRRNVVYKVAASDDKSVTINVREPATGQMGSIQILFDGPDRFYVNPADGVGWKEYYQRVSKRG